MPGCRGQCWLVVLLLFASIGCGGKAAPDPQTEDADASPTAVVESSSAVVKTVETAKLPKLGNALPPQDGGRIVDLAPPGKWQPLGRDNAHVARFVVKKSNPNDLPRIMVTATDATGFTENVTAENVAAFAESVASELDEGKLLEAPKPLIIGSNAYARYVVKASKGARLVARQVLETVFAGRRYAITLEVYDAQLRESGEMRDLAYAVAAGIQYTTPGDAALLPKPEAPAEE